ncbi:NAD(P)-binding protein [Hyaloscypha variabilis F]|uniref:NAD(P)-binding protein n=1 Tax=Hyaloscypha variabilis (strain UAMH 11265 / GT02V1 / F) TaxID=1149755 RepID=A0A2J6QSM2_HYAVF|nr:NAD(P)-binding protein [Hyaloscypha variabilis F]
MSTFLHSSNPPLSEIKATNSRLTAGNAPRNAVFVGATSGIGKATLTRLVAQQTPIKIYVIGRNAAKQQNFLDQLRGSNSQADIVFLEGEVSLMAEVRRVCDEIKGRESSLDALFLSTGYIPWGGREETSEGIELFSALAYYGRLLFVLHLLPLLKASTHNPRIVNLGGAGLETSKLLLDDIDLQKPANWSIGNLAAQIATAMSLTLSRLAEENPNVVFVFANPGLVVTNIYNQGYGGKWYMKAFVGIMKPAMKIVALSEADAGERCLYLLTSAWSGRDALTMMKTKSGALFSITYKFETVQWEGVMTESQRKDAGNKFWSRMQEVLRPYL